MRPRKGYNPKRRIEPREKLTLEACEELSRKVTYSGSPLHKMRPGDYGLITPVSPRPMKTLCDLPEAISKKTAERLLKKGAAKGMISTQRRNGWPQNIWAVTDGGEPYEAQLGNREQGEYHGYPMSLDDDFRAIVLSEWEQR